MKTIEPDKRNQPEFGFLIKHCAFCGIGIKPNFWNACVDCKEESSREPEEFLIRAFGRMAV